MFAKIAIENNQGMAKKIIHLFLWTLTAGLALGSTWSLLRFGPLVNSWLELAVYCLLLFVILPAGGIVILAGVILILEKYLNF